MGDVPNTAERCVGTTLAFDSDTIGEAIASRSLNREVARRPPRKLENFARARPRAASSALTHRKGSG